MGVKRTQETSRNLTRDEVRQAALRAALQLDSESDVYHELPPDGAEDGAGTPVLSPVQWQAIRLLVAGRRGVDVATECGVTPETVSRWKSAPLFAAAYNQVLRESHTATVGELRSVAQDALSVLRESLTSTDERLRLTAALSVLRMSLQLDAGAVSLPVTPKDVARAELDKRHADMMSGLFSF